MKKYIKAHLFRNLLLLSLSVCITVISCRKDPQITDDGMVKAPEDLTFRVPQGWPQPHYNFENNTVTPAGFRLGRKLFFDTRLSRDNSTSCGSCHQPFSAFAQLDHPVSHGVDNLLGTRNSPALFNLNWHTSFFWDGGVNHIENQPINPIQNPVEMDENINALVTKLGADAGYRADFAAAFGNDSVTSQRIFKALTQFMGMLVSSNSKYDQYKRGEAGVTFNASEQNGYTIFKNNCAACHSEPLFTDFSFRCNGLAPNVHKDSGRAHITRDAADMYRFKIPSLRNLKYTPPYMHDGRYGTLAQVLDYYTGGIDTTMATLDPLLKHRLQLTASQKADLTAFLNTLNDESFVKDPRFQEVIP